MVMGRAAMMPMLRPESSTETIIFESSGRYFDTGSLICSRPSSTSCISVVLTIGLVIE